MNVRVKICGITNLEDALAAVDAGADALGFIFYESSPRKVSTEAAGNIIRELPPFVAKVGVFVNASEEMVRRAVGECGLDTLQFHGDESPEFCGRFSAVEIENGTASLTPALPVPRLRRSPRRGGTDAGALAVSTPAMPAPRTWTPLKIYKAFRIQNLESLEALPAYKTDAWLLDSFVAGKPGGTGAKFNWDLAVEAKKIGRPIILAGGMTPENVAQAVRKVQPFAVDVSSGVESLPGKKDHTKVRRFIAAAKAASEKVRE